MASMPSQRCAAMIRSIPNAAVSPRSRDGAVTDTAIATSATTPTATRIVESGFPSDVRQAVRPTGAARTSTVSVVQIVRRVAAAARSGTLGSRKRTIARI